LRHWGKKHKTTAAFRPQLFCVFFKQSVIRKVGEERRIEMIRYLIQAEDVQSFIVELYDECEAYVNFKLYQVDGGENEDKLILKGWLKFSGCSDTTCETSFHFCEGLYAWAIFTDAVAFMMKKARELMESCREDSMSELEDWPKPEEYVLVTSEYKGEIRVAPKEEIT
jgi:hypothetical protein